MTHRARSWAFGSAILGVLVSVGAVLAQDTGASPSETKQIVWQDNVAVIGADASDPPSTQVFQPGTLFWRTDLRTFRYYSAGAWHSAPRYVYNTNRTNTADDWERASFGWSGPTNVFQILTEAAGTGTARSIQITGQGGYSVNIAQTSIYPSNSAMEFGSITLPWAVAYLGTSTQGSKPKSLADGAAAVSFVEFSAIPQNSYMGGELICTATSTDATDYRSLTERIRYAAVSKGTAVTGTISVIGTDLLASSNGNTLVCTWTEGHATASTLKLQVTCTDNTAGSQTIVMNCRRDEPIPFAGTVTYP